ncbi:MULTISPECIES: hotdog fold thioesterase [Pantoea]|jgi:1,4-dihydroxy-2-naphthoyl-CoA hydrolase|uniref:hotdog fold thioesterase n=1 Tax=Pantoea TaxID=53335 RepID=UPI000BB57166|nr:MULTISPECIES: hotdog fold thioesterase [Pantoea]MBZ6386652.1 hotdog fold thioesterase [Pantoea piersonii]MBZ6399277.1 hotdog fold thioesterase [Pantoea piersonii]MBZ6406775.1 hotdog fold thioesterase [Pantoea piersonii]MBZ6429052.1 hotdog fold thioesterase [Pantoea piersonii]MCG7389335.1 hotdog fold thioesterase [Pantoea sp. ACRSB]
MAIWKRETDLDALNAIGENSLVAHIGIRFTAIGDDYLEAVMPVDARTHQPFGLLHGGASVVLAESMGSIAGYLCTEEGKSVVGIEVNASHHRSVSSGEVRGICRPLHIGSRNQVWQIEIRNARGQLCCSSRLTVAVLG